jgi:CubicO group peptidase (beta-lactamase class C family)
MVEVHGFCDERFAVLGGLFRASLQKGTDEGASVAASVNGELVVDLWGGFRDLARTKVWDADTVVRVFSTSKVVVAIATLMVWDRGLVDLDEPIATYWPEFGENGKAAMTTRQVLVHTSGLPGFGKAITVDDVLDWDRMVRIVERAPAWYEPGTITCYHQTTLGYILGELVHRVSGVAFEQFVADEITGPLDADFHFALSAPRDLARVAEVWGPQSPRFELPPMGERAYAEIEEIVPALYGTELMAADIPAGSGITNARALTPIGSIMALDGEVDGRRYLSRHAVKEACREQSYAEDQAMGGVPIRRGLFFGLHSKEFPAPTPTTIHWGGHGGSWLSMDPASGTTCAYTPNRLLDGEDYLVRSAEQWQTLNVVMAPS